VPSEASPTFSPASKADSLPLKKSTQPADSPKCSSIKLTRSTSQEVLHLSLRVSKTSVWNSETQKLYDIFLYPTQQEVMNEASKNHIYELGTGSGKTFISLHHYVKHSKAPLLIIVP